MNVKANMLIAEDEWVRDLFVFPRAATSRTRSAPPTWAISTSVAGRGRRRRPAVRAAYLGPDVADADVERVIRARDVGSRIA